MTMANQIDADYELFKVALDKEPEKFTDTAQRALEGDDNAMQALNDLREACGKHNDLLTLYKMLYYVQQGRTNHWRQAYNEAMELVREKGSLLKDAQDLMLGRSPDSGKR
jgi:hypothetical protein